MISYFVSFVVLYLPDIDAYKPLMAQIILWLSFSIPYSQLLFSINFQIFTSYFKHIWNVLSLEGIKNHIKYDFEQQRCRKFGIIIKYCAIAFFTILYGIVLIVEMIEDYETATYSSIIGMICVIPLIYGFLKVLFNSIVCLFKKSLDSQDEVDINDSSNSIKEALNEDPSEVSTITNENNQSNNDNQEIKQSLIDPCGIMNQIDYFRFFEDTQVNYFASIFRKRRFTLKMIPALLIFGCVIGYIACEARLAIERNLTTKHTKSILMIAARIAFYVFSLPFLMIFNFSILIFEFKKLKEKHSYIFKMFLFTVCGYIIMIISCLVVITLFYTRFDAYLRNDLHVTYQNNYTDVNMSEPASICTTTYYGLNLIQYAGLAALGQKRDDELSQEIIKYMFDGEEK